MALPADYAGVEHVHLPAMLVSWLMGGGAILGKPELGQLHPSQMLSLGWRTYEVGVLAPHLKEADLKEHSLGVSEPHPCKESLGRRWCLECQSNRCWPWIGWSCQLQIRAHTHVSSLVRGSMPMRLFSFGPRTGTPSDVSTVTRGKELQANGARQGNAGGIQDIRHSCGC